MSLNSTALAAALGLSRGRISQMVSAGHLDGCFQGDGRERRFDLTKALAALNGSLDKGQMLTNGAPTKRAIRQLQADRPVPEAAAAKAPAPRPAEDRALAAGDPDRYELARMAKAEEDVRAMRLRNGREEGQYVLAAEVAREVSQAIGQEVREMETFLRASARVLADKMGLDFKAARQILMEEWRQHRAGRAAHLMQDAAGREMTAAEEIANI